MSFYSPDSQEKELEKLRYENEKLKETLEEFEKRNLTDKRGNPISKSRATWPAIFSVVVTVLVFVFNDSTIHYLAGKGNFTGLDGDFGLFINSFFAWFGLILSCFIIFTVSFVIFDLIISKIEKISQTGAHSSPDSPLYKRAIPPVLFFSLPLLLAYLSMI